MARLTKEQILQATDVDRGEVEVPEWGGSVLVSALDAQHVSHLISSGFIVIDSGGGTADISKLDLIDLARRAMIDDEGNELFTRTEAKKLASKSWAAINRVALKALELSGFAEGEEEGEEKNE